MNYNRYFAINQKVFLINISEERDETIFNSFTGTVLICNEETIMLKTAYRLYSGELLNLKPGTQFKLTTEALGMGVQIRAELEEIVSSDEIKLHPLGELSVYQRRLMTRINIDLPLLHVPQKSSLAAFQREWRRAVDNLHKPDPPQMKLNMTRLNLSTGGLRLNLATPTTRLSLIVFDLQDQKPPVCAVAELVWQNQDEEQSLFKCGHRFVEILKEDQERIDFFVEKTSGVRSSKIKSSELSDRMVP